jgi:hypothetical protein
VKSTTETTAHQNRMSKPSSSQAAAANERALAAAEMASDVSSGLMPPSIPELGLRR